MVLWTDSESNSSTTFQARRRGQPHGIYRHPYQIQVSEAFREHLSKLFNLRLSQRLKMKGVGTVSTDFLSTTFKEATDTAIVIG